MQDATLFVPVNITECDYENLTIQQRAAMKAALKPLGYNVKNMKARVERYNSDDICHLVYNCWNWPVRLSDVIDKRDKKRIQKIIEIIPFQGVWPYVSYWADTIQKLSETNREFDGELVVLNHGDGWHRIVAQLELKRKTIDILFPLRKHNG